MHNLLRRVLLRVIPGDVILVQPAARVHSRNTQYLSLARRACDHVSSQVVNACVGLRLVRDGLVNNHRRNQKRSFNLDGIGTGLLQNGYGRGGRYTHCSESCYASLLLALGFMSKALRLRMLLFSRRIGENGDVW